MGVDEIKLHKKTNDILVHHMKTYMEKMSSALFLATILITIGELIISILVINNHLSYYLSVQNNIPITKKGFLFETCIHTIYLWLIYLTFILLFNKTNYNTQINLLSITFMLYVTVFCICHWKYSYLSILYCLPVGVVAPLGKKQHLCVFILSILFTVSYSILQNYFFNKQFNFLICIVSVISITIFFLVSLRFKDCMMLALSDVEKYYSLSNNLNEKLQHDYLTGAYAKSELLDNLKNDKSLKSMAFLDLDNFKTANDTFGHDIGDYILRTLVSCITNKKEKVYRYGGDEFIILSKLSDKELASLLNIIQSDFNSTCIGVFMCDISFSAGVVRINEKDDFDTLLNKCDKAMYSSKKNGKNRITTVEC